ncbi:MAG: thioredoxin [Myxococcaceae bacterium]|nr:MAG: thioredoxin [Myxococcaceae bacterium]
MAAKVTTDATFKNDVLDSDVPVLVDFWAEWCGPCRMVGPTVDEIATEYAGKARAFKLNVDDNPSVPVQYGIRSIPTVLIFKNGQVVDRIIGAVPKTTLTQTLDKHL